MGSKNIGSPTSPCAPEHPPPRLAYVMSRFPKLTETFVLYEILEMRRLGFAVEIFPLMRHKDQAEHPETATLADHVHHAEPWSATVVATSLQCLLRHPLKWLTVLWEVIHGNLRSPARLLRTLVLFPKMVWMAMAVQRHGIEHIHAHFATHPALAALVVYRLTGIGYSFTGHGSDLHVDQTMLGHKVAASRFCVMISDYNRRFVIDHAHEPIAQQLVVVRSGIDPQVFQPRAGGPLPGATLRILMVASLREVKGHRVLLEACRQLTTAGINYRCDLVGDGPIHESIASMVRNKGLSQQVHLLGPQTRQQVAAQMLEAHILVMPSVLTRDGRREGIPVVLMEAMASGLAVVASHISGIPELVLHEETGLLFPPGDGTALAGMLQRLAGDPVLRQRLGRQAREWVMEAYDMRRNARRLADLFCAQG